MMGGQGMRECPYCKGVALFGQASYILYKICAGHGTQGFLTATMKVRRRNVYQVYAAVIEALYQDQT